MRRHREEEEKKNAFDAFEEKRFYLHGCFDSFGMVRFAKSMIYRRLVGVKMCAEEKTHQTLLGGHSLLCETLNDKAGNFRVSL